MENSKNQKSELYLLPNVELPEKLVVFTADSLCKTDTITIETQLIGIIGKAFVKLGYSTSDKESEISYMVGELAIELKRRCPGMRIPEIAEAVTNGIFGDYGEFYGLNVVTIVKFCTAYMDSEKRRNAMREFLDAIQPKTLPPSPAAIQAENERLILAAYDTFLQRGYYEDFGNFIYGQLEKLNLIQLTAQRKTQIMQQAKHQLEEKYSESSKTWLQARDNARKLADVVNNTEAGEAQVTSLAKKIALNIVFKDFAELETDLKELIEFQKSSQNEPE